MNRKLDISKIVRVFITVLFMYIILYSIFIAAEGFITGKARNADAEKPTDALELASQEHLELLKALRTEHQEKVKKEAALKETQDNIDLLKVKEQEKQKAMEAAVTAPVESPKE